MQDDLIKQFDVPAARAVVDVVRRAGGEARFVGGCVRDAVLGVPFQDFDLAVTLLPEVVLDVFRSAGFKVVPIGLAHGTVLVVSCGRPFELTTLRRDVRPDGRHAEVAFTDDWKADAARRDFTMNAIFCDIEGHLTDFFGGVDDARAGRVRFVGEARARIREDVLRILRYFRFSAWYGRGSPDSEGYEACCDLIRLLPALSAERVGAEVMKLLAAPDPVGTVELMQRAGVFEVLQLPFDCLERLRKVVGNAEASEDVHRLWAVASDEADYQVLASRLRLSKSVLKRLVLMRQLIMSEGVFRGGLEVFSAKDARRLAYLYGVQAVKDAMAVSGLKEVAGFSGDWSVPRFPLRGGDVIAAGRRRGLDLKGAPVGAYLRAVESWWLERDFQPGREDCLAELQHRVDVDVGLVT